MARSIFLKSLGVIYLIAFVSLWTQIPGLVGSNGILPAKGFLEAVAGRFGLERYWFLPTLCWFNASDGFLQFLCAGGAFLSILLIVGIAPAPVLFLLWLFYLSLSIVCREFLSFQWDALLLETGFLAIFLAPLCLLPKRSSEPPSPLALWLLRILLFKLMFSSGVVKLASGDPTWRHLTALNFHYETQPLPTWVGWYAHQLPEWFQKLSTIVMFFMELIVPFSIFAPRRLRKIGCALLVVFQLLIMATGNYCFFNLLTLALCVLLLEDTVWPQGPSPRCWPRWIVVPVASVMISVSAFQLLGLFRVRSPWLFPVAVVQNILEPFRSLNRYGLFAVMTTSRPEIIVEGSNDGETWLAYEFKYKPGDLKRVPGFVAPHQPRLDWQMWFAALGTYRQNPWFMNFCNRLLQGSPEVLTLLANNPFPTSPPKYIRAAVYDYHFTDLKTKQREGAWWRREERHLYCPILTRREK